MTLSSANSCGFWNVLMMPEAAILSGLAPLISRPCQSTRPEVGTRSPARRLSSVVLPEPFGPMMPMISPRLISNEISDAATRPPNRFVRPWTSRNMAPALEQPTAPPRHEEKGKDKDGTVGRPANFPGQIEDLGEPCPPQRPPNPNQEPTENPQKGHGDGIQRLCDGELR